MFNNGIPSKFIKDNKAKQSIIKKFNEFVLYGIKLKHQFEEIINRKKKIDRLKLQRKLNHKELKFEKLLQQNYLAFLNQFNLFIRSRKNGYGKFSLEDFIKHNMKILNYNSNIVNELIENQLGKNVTITNKIKLDHNNCLKSHTTPDLDNFIINSSDRCSTNNYQGTYNHHSPNDFWLDTNDNITGNAIHDNESTSSQSQNINKYFANTSKYKTEIEDVLNEFDIQQKKMTTHIPNQQINFITNNSSHQTNNTIPYIQQIVKNNSESIPVNQFSTTNQNYISKSTPRMSLISPKLNKPTNNVIKKPSEMYLQKVKKTELNDKKTRTTFIDDISTDSETNKESNQPSVPIPPAYTHNHYTNIGTKIYSNKFVHGNIGNKPKYFVNKIESNRIDIDEIFKIPKNIQLKPYITNYEFIASQLDHCLYSIVNEACAISSTRKNKKLMKQDIILAIENYKKRIKKQINKY